MTYGEVLSIFLEIGIVFCVFGSAYFTYKGFEAKREHDRLYKELKEREKMTKAKFNETIWKNGDPDCVECGHPYHRHFDSYENWNHVGCKYCECDEYVAETTQRGYYLVMENGLLFGPVPADNPEHDTYMHPSILEKVTKWTKILNQEWKYVG